MKKEIASILSGWLIFAVALITYTLTLEPTASFWDSGEFISAAYKLQIPHAPGAPLYLLVGKMFSFLSFGDVSQVAFWVNMVSAISSALTVMFLFWSIVMLGRKILKIQKGKETGNQFSLLIAAASIGALAYAFSDSFWFSAVEAEVYALSSFFSAFVFWAILKWDLFDDDQKANKWLILIAYMIGLSIGIHPLNLLTIPALCLVYYFKKYPFNRIGLFITIGISAVIIWVLLFGIRIGLTTLAKQFEILFVNNFGLPFGVGAAFVTVSIIAFLIYGIIYSTKRKKIRLNTALLALTFVLIGYSSYSLIVIRSNFNPPLDPTNPEDVPSFVSYLNMEQYPTRPLFYGPNFTADIVDQKKGAPVYVKGEKKYEVPAHKFDIVYDPADSNFLPRVYSQEDHHVAAYRKILDLAPGEKPSFADNLKFMFQHQLGHMYWRYFLWNFSGKESDVQNANWLAVWDSNKQLPSGMAHDKARNNFYMFPLLLGLIGLFFSFRKDLKSSLVVMTLFLMTGAILVLYLNPPPIEPRERDYIYVASFFAFCIWIGIGVISIGEFVGRYIRHAKLVPALTFVVTLIVPGIMLFEGWDDHDRSNRYYSVDAAYNTLASCPPNAILFTGGDNDTYSLWYLQEVEGFRRDVRVIVGTYFNADWNIDQMTRKAYASEVLPFSFEKQDFKRGTNDYVYLNADPKFESGVDLKQYLKLVKDQHPALVNKTSNGDTFTITPTRTFKINVNKENVLAKNALSKDNVQYLQDSMEIKIKKNGIYKGDLMLLDLIAHNNWERPICFTFTGAATTGLEIDNYLVQRGFTYQLLPVRNSDPNEELVDTEAMYTNMMENAKWRELDNKDVYYNAYYRNQMLNPRSNFNTLAQSLIRKGKLDRARDVLKRSLDAIPDDTIPYDINSAQSVSLLLNVGEDETAKHMATTMSDRADEALTYYYIKNPDAIQNIRQNLVTLNFLTQAFKASGKLEEAALFEERFMKHYQKFNNL
ncbi:DUF2723 domain-containing protein [Fulvivirgaceae bacterium BMA10]|uniref:DUF2723 domain-containing protein n=1 Tax=Splendidivirga corallicola TaxID=3051826 RepID=A0ABT8KJ85_9BACT|nr:DUF2723 domain-containing protein [Fulvivirgaceae bacterium BMA10]